jgi:hypothetical protein
MIRDMYPELVRATKHTLRSTKKIGQVILPLFGLHHLGSKLECFSFFENDMVVKELSTDKSMKDSRE